MSRKCYTIAVIIAGIDEEYQNEILTGIEEFTSSSCVNTAVFVSFSGVIGNQRHDAGEFNIFNLPDFKLFDGAILLTNTIGYQPVINDILQRIKDAGIPAVSLDNDVKEFYHIGIDNGKAMREITEHFINVHNCKSFGYISGPPDNSESAARLKSFLDVLEKNNLSISENHIYYGDFRSPSGRDAVESFINSDEPMPQAIICANDVMAVAAITTLQSAGFNVPGDILVSGFDNTYTAKNYPMEITSVERPLKASGILACQLLFNHFEHKTQSRSRLLDMKPIFKESCGCMEHISNETCLHQVRKGSVKLDHTPEYLSLVNRMSCQLVECDSLSEFTQSLKPYIDEINAEGFYLCICSDWNIDSSTSTNDKSFTIKGYTKDILLPLAYHNGSFCKLPMFNSSDILPGLFENSGKGQLYYFIPLHFRERCLGYIAIMNSRFPLQSAMFQTWCITLSNMLENIRKIISLDLAVKKLDKLYAVDTLSGIYNRNGFVKYTTEPFAECITNRRPVMLMFLDMDGLKKINDSYGHAAGDNAIHSIANVIRESCTQNEVFCRFGGDEFIIFAADYSEDNARKLTETIVSNIEKFNNSNDAPYSLSASIGFHIAFPTQEDDIFNLVTIADKIMYKEKRRKKMSKYLMKTDE